LFDEATTLSVYEKQTKAATAKNESDCPLCAVVDETNKGRIYKFDEMDADHVSAWSKGGDSSARTARCSALPTTEPRASVVLSVIALIGERRMKA
jgi:hypothetical protein